MDFINWLSLGLSCLACLGVCAIVGYRIWRWSVEGR